MSYKQYSNTLWFAEDNSWGEGDILLVNTDDWSQKQKDWLEWYLNFCGGEPSTDQVLRIENGLPPENWDEEEEEGDDE